MDFIKQINATIEYIEKNLDGEISYDEISRLASCSIYNFQRMFSYIADKPLSEYIRHRRLTLAAFDILNTQDRIIDISIKYGYESQDSFTRAFKSFHGVLPSVVRNKTVQLKSCPKLSFQITIKGENHMNYQIEQWPSFKVAGIKKRITTENAFKEVPKIWDVAWKDGTMKELINLLQKTDYRPAGILGIISGGAYGNIEETDYMMAVTNHVDVPNCKYIDTPEGMEEISYPSATWVIFEANGKLPEAVQKIHKQFYTEWLPSSGYRLASLPIIESYMMDDHQEVWIPIVKE